MAHARRDGAFAGAGAAVLSGEKKTVRYGGQVVGLPALTKGEGVWPW